MSYTLADGLSPRPNIVQFADYWEIECLKKADYSASILDIIKSKGIADDVQETEEEAHESELEEEQIRTVEEIRRRVNSCSNKYPFKLDDRGYVLSLDNNVSFEATIIYLYLLLATRNNMTSNKVISTIDGTKVFESLSRDVLMNYLGSSSEGMVFGTADDGGFNGKLEELILKMKDGVLHATRAQITYNPQDDTLDVVAWVPFFDPFPSKLICFGQCKTGTHWKGTTKQLDIDGFLKKWFSYHPALTPIRTFLIADVLPREDYYHRAVSNLFFDRCRVASFSTPKRNDDWYPNLELWTLGLLQQQNINLPQPLLPS